MPHGCMPLSRKRDSPLRTMLWIVKRLERYLGTPAEDQGLAFGFPGPVGVLMPGSDPVQPDYVVVLATNAAILRERWIIGVPDLIEAWS